MTARARSVMWGRAERITMRTRSSKRSPKAEPVNSAVRPGSPQSQNVLVATARLLHPGPTEGESYRESKPRVDRETDGDQESREEGATSVGAEWHPWTVLKKS